MLKKSAALISFFSLFLFSATSVQAVCPVCTVAVVAGLGLSRWLGIDDTVSGIWIGGLILSLSFWTLSWSKKKFNLKPGADLYLAFPIIALYFLLLLLPLSLTHVIGHPLNKLWGIDKLVLGSVVGIVAFLVGIYLDKLERKLKGHQFFAFQKVIFPVAALLIMSIIFLVTTKK